MNVDIDSMVQGYITAALWADCMCACVSGDCDCESGGREHLDVQAGDESYIRDLCVQFVEEHRADCEAYVEIMEREQWNAEYDSSSRLGHDLRLTSGGHGAGFWDRGLGELGDRLTKACDHGTVYSRRGGGDVWDAGNGFAAFDHYGLGYVV